MKTIISKISIVLVIFIMLFPVGYWLRNANRNSLAHINSFRVYYGNIDENIIREINELDMVILESLQINSEQVEGISEKTMLFGYLSVIEIANWDRELISRIDGGDYLTLNGQKVVEKDYGNSLGNIGQDHYRQVLLETIEQRIISKGFDGIFLDTVGWIDYYKSHDPETYAKLIHGYEQFLKSIKQQYPSLMIIQNRGFDSFNTTSNRYVDGLLWENFDIEKYGNASRRVEEVNKTAKASNVSIFLMLAKNTPQNMDFAKENQWPAIYNQHSYSVW